MDFVVCSLGALRDSIAFIVEEEILLTACDSPIYAFSCSWLFLRKVGIVSYFIISGKIKENISHLRTCIISIRDSTVFHCSVFFIISFYLFIYLFIYLLLLTATAGHIRLPDNKGPFGLP